MNAISVYKSLKSVIEQAFLLIPDGEYILCDRTNYDETSASFIPFVGDGYYYEYVVERVVKSKDVIFFHCFEMQEEVNKVFILEEIWSLEMMCYILDDIYAQLKKQESDILPYKKVFGI